MPGRFYSQRTQMLFLRDTACVNQRGNSPEYNTGPVGCWFGEPPNGSRLMAIVVPFTKFASAK